MIPYRLALLLAAAGLLLLTGRQPALAQSVEPALKPLIEAANLNVWPWRKQPPPFEHPDGAGIARSLARDYRGQVVLLYMFAEW